MDSGEQKRDGWVKSISRHRGVLHASKPSLVNLRWFWNDSAELHGSVKITKFKETQLKTFLITLYRYPHLFVVHNISSYTRKLLKKDLPVTVLACIAPPKVLPTSTSRTHSLTCYISFVSYVLYRLFLSQEAPRWWQGQLNADLQWFNSSPCCSDVKVYFRVFQYTMTTLVGVDTDHRLLSLWIP